jgi:hypothetical protein
VLTGHAGRWYRTRPNASVHADAADVDGPSRPLATFKALCDGQDAGNTSSNVHARLTPAFGVTVPALDTPQSEKHSREVLISPSSQGTRMLRRVSVS